MTAVAEKTDTAPVPPVAPRDGLALWHVRAGAFAIDILPGAAVAVTMALTALALPLRGPWWWGSVSVGGLAILFVTVNRWLLPAVTGWSLGRALFGIVVVARDGAPVGPWRLLLRDLAHLLDTISVLVGWLWPLVDSRRRTFADLLLRTEVRRVDPDLRPGDARRRTAAVMMAAGLLCAAGAGVGYLVVYRYDRSVEQARAQIATTGPRIVEQMLTYDPKSLPDDFARAASLTTDKYREQLADQQEQVQKGHPVLNQYWVTNSAIQSATPDRATMLLFMQGQRGALPDARYISATVRVTLAKSAGGQWLVDDLAVVTKPDPAQSGK